MGKKRTKRKKREQDIFTVEAILAKRATSAGTEYKLRWAGYSAADDTWEHERNLLCDTLVRNFEALQNERPKANLLPHLTMGSHSPEALYGTHQSSETSHSPVIIKPKKRISTEFKSSNGSQSRLFEADPTTFAYFLRKNQEQDEADAKSELSTSTTETMISLSSLNIPDSMSLSPSMSPITPPCLDSSSDTFFMLYSPENTEGSSTTEFGFDPYDDHSLVTPSFNIVTPDRPMKRHQVDANTQWQPSKDDIFPENPDDSLQLLMNHLTQGAADAVSTKMI